MVGTAACDERGLVDEEGGLRRVEYANGGDIERGVIDAGLGNMWKSDIDAVCLLAVSLYVRGSHP